MTSANFQVSWPIGSAQRKALTKRAVHGWGQSWLSTAGTGSHWESSLSSSSGGYPSGLSPAVGSGLRKPTLTYW
jgi:hypothetical protein